MSAERAAGLCRYCGLRIETFSYEGHAFLKDHRVISDPAMEWCEGCGTPPSDAALAEADRG